MCRKLINYSDKQNDALVHREGLIRQSMIHVMCGERSQYFKIYDLN